MGPIGLLANPAAGKDIRRLVAQASVFDNQEKSAIIRRAVAGAVAAGAREFHYLADGRGITQAGLEAAGGAVRANPITIATRNGALATEHAAREMRAAGCVAVLVLGGDGTSRAFARGWQDAPLLAVSTGTNNVFPEFREATVAGAVLGALATGAVQIDEVTTVSKLVELELSTGQRDIALIDAVASTDQFVGSRALLDPTRLRTILLTRADPAAIGMTAIGGLVDPVTAADDFGLHLTITPAFPRARRDRPRPVQVNAPIAPGLHLPVNIAALRRWQPGDTVEIDGDQVLAFDGEREHRLAPDESARATLKRAGPRVIDVDRAMQLAAQRGVFIIRPRGKSRRR